MRPDAYAHKLVFGRHGCILEMPPSEVPGRAVSEDAAASWSAAALCRFAIYAQKTVLTHLAPKPKRQRAGALQKLRHVVAPPRGRCADAPTSNRACENLF